MDNAEKEKMDTWQRSNQSSKNSRTPTRSPRPPPPYMPTWHGQAAAAAGSCKNQAALQVLLPPPPPAMAAASSSSSSSSPALISSFRGPEIRKPRSVNVFTSVSLQPFPQIRLRQSRKTSSGASGIVLCSSSVSVSTPEVQQAGRPDDLVASILSKVIHTDGGVSLTKEGHKEVAEVAQELQKYCVAEPVKCPLIFGEWDVVYCSRPTSPGGGYRSALGRLFFRTKEMIQAVEAPDTVRNKVSFSALGFLDGEVSLKGKLKVLDDSWIQVIFEAPQLRVGALEFQYGRLSEVKLQITYIDDKLRLGKGSRGSLFVFRRRT